jgi:hypothetical protein
MAAATKSGALSAALRIVAPCRCLGGAAPRHLHGFSTLERLGIYACATHRRSTALTSRTSGLQPAAQGVAVVVVPETLAELRVIMPRRPQIARASRTPADASVAVDSLQVHTGSLMAWTAGPSKATLSTFLN